MRPIMVIRSKRMQEYNMEKGNDIVVKCLGYILNFMINNLMLNGQIENWVMIFDLKDQSLSNINFKVLLFI